MAFYSDKCIESIKNRLPISSVMSNYTRLEKKGGTYWVKCPFHGGGNEKTASCKLDDDKGLYYCFGCGAKGNIFSLVMQKENLDFPSSIEFLAQKAGVTLEEERGKDNISREEREKSREEKDVLYELYSRLANSFHHLLLNSDEARGAREYLEKRKISSETTEKFLLGYAPENSNFLISFLTKRGYSPDFLYKSSGLFSDKTSTHWPLFRSRLMFPIRDRMGRVIAFSGRDLTFSDKAPKYINSPETMIYQKKDNFFGLYEAKDSIGRGRRDPILCEGNFDVISMHQAGFTEAVASLGTSFTSEQCQNMRRWFPTVKAFNLLFDSDEAGQKSTERAVKIINNNHLEQYVHTLTTAKDSSELLERGGSERVKMEYKPFKTGYEFLEQRALDRFDPLTDRGKDAIINMMGSYVVNSSILSRDRYLDSLSRVLNLKKEELLKSLSKAASDEGKEEEISLDGITLEINGKTTIVPYELYVVLYLSNHRNLFRQYKAEFSANDLIRKEAKSIYSALDSMSKMMMDDCTDDEFITLVNDKDAQQQVFDSFALDEYKNKNLNKLNESLGYLKIDIYNHLIESRTESLKYISSFEQQEEIMEEVQNLGEKIKKLKEEISNIYEEKANK